MLRQRTGPWDRRPCRGVTACAWWSTRDNGLRFCNAEGQMKFKTSGGLAAPPGYVPWFDVPGAPPAESGLWPLVHARLAELQQPVAGHGLRLGRRPSASVRLGADGQRVIGSVSLRRNAQQTDVMQRQTVCRALIRLRSVGVVTVGQN